VHTIHPGPLIAAAWATGCGAVILGLLRPSPTGTRSNLALGLGVLAGVGVYGAAVALDVGLDIAPAQTFQTTVLDMRVSHGKSTTYSLYLTPWADDSDRSVNVSSKLYYGVAVGSQLCPQRHPGAFGLPWFELKLCAP
jgi:hypothetical protein